MDTPKKNLADVRRIAFNPHGERDQIFQESEFPRRFEFNEDVARVFDDMVLRSIPLYEEVLNNVIAWTYHVYQDGTSIYDLGCSTGSTLYSLASMIPKRMHLVGVDSSSAMVDRAREKLAKFFPVHDIELSCENILRSSIDNASVVIMNYTLQFLPVLKRPEILVKIYEGLRPGGILYLSEKLRSSDPVFQEMFTSIYERFKLGNGYTRTEIELKKEALDNVLIPFSIEEHQGMLRDIGFKHSELSLRWNNFASIVAMK